MYITPLLYNFNLQSGIQIFTSCMQHIENNLLTLIETNTDKTILANYKLDNLLLDNDVNEENYNKITSYFFELSTTITINHNMVYLYNIDKILKIIEE